MALSETVRKHNQLWSRLSALISKRRSLESEFKEQAVSLTLNLQLSKTQISEEQGSDSEELDRLRPKSVHLKQECAFQEKLGMCCAK